MGTELIINVTSQEMRIARLENKVLTDIQVERKSSTSESRPTSDALRKQLGDFVLSLGGKLCVRPDEALETPQEFGRKTPKALDLLVQKSSRRLELPVHRVHIAAEAPTETGGGKLVEQVIPTVDRGPYAVEVVVERKPARRESVRPRQSPL